MARGSPGSAGLDLPASRHVIITPEDEIHIVPTGVFGPLPKNTMGLVLGRSSALKAGLQVIPGVIDSDYTGEIKIMIHPGTRTIQVFPGQRIAQLLLLPYVTMQSQVLDPNRGEKGFGSTDIVAWVQQITRERPMQDIKVNGKTFKGLIDTGADVSCIAGKDWPANWPTQNSHSSLIGLGQATNIAKSSSILHWEFENHNGTFQPYVIPSLPFTLWGRDVLSQMDMKIGTDEAFLS